MAPMNSGSTNHDPLPYAPSPMGVPIPEPAATMPAAVPGLVSVAVAGEVVVFDARSGAAHRLNPTAALVLERCDGRRSVAEACGEISDQFGIDVAVVTDDVGMVLADFAERGLVASTASRDQGVSGTADRRPQTVGSTHRVTRRYTVGPIQTLDVAASIATDDEELHRSVDALLGSLSATSAHAEHESRTEASSVTYELLPVLRGIDVLCDGQPVGNARGADAALALVQWHLNGVVAEQSGRRVLVHASAASLPDGRVALFPGEANSGKSTLVAGLTRAGYGYVTDETVAIDMGSGRVEGYRKPVNLDPGSWPLFPDAVPADAASRGDEHLVDPRALHPDALAAAAEGPVGLVVFPTYRAGATTTAEPLSPPAALVSLVVHCTNLGDHGQAGLDALARLVVQAPAFDMVMGGLDDAVAVIAKLTAPGPTRASHRG